VNFVINHDRGTISPLAPGQKFTHREFGGQLVIKDVIDYVAGSGGPMTVIFDDKLTDSKYVRRADWASEDAFFTFLKFTSWAFNGPVAIDFRDYPHKCPRCTKPAYVGACGGGDVDCTNPDCPTRKR
jgi:hypothetical protein